MKDFFKKNKIQLAIYIYLIIIGMILFFIARPIILKINEKNNRIQENIADQESRKDRISNLPAVRNQIEMVNNQEDKTELLLNDENTVNLIEKLEKISEETGNNIKIELSQENSSSQKANSSKKNSEKKEVITDNLPSDTYIKMNISLKGRYENFLAFLRKLENSDYYSDVISFNITNYQKSLTSSSNPFKEVSNGADDVVNNDVVLTSLGVVFYLEKK